MKISFVIPSVDREKKLQECIIGIEKAYEYAKFADIEILVIFQGRQENMVIKTKYLELISFYHIDERGLSRARNFGIKKSKGEYLVFIDDDTLIREDFLDILLKKNTSLGVAAFCCRDTDPVKIRFYSVSSLKNKPKFLNRLEFRYFAGSAHIIKRSAIDRIGFYDENFGIGAKYPGAEESDMFFRLKKYNEEIVYLPKLTVYHPIGCFTSEVKCFNYSYAVGAMLTKQIFLDRQSLFIYLFIIFGILFKGFIRTLQAAYFLKSIETKNSRFRYRSVLKGTLKGVWIYLKSVIVKVS